MPQVNLSRLFKSTPRSNQDLGHALLQFIQVFHRLWYTCYCTQPQIFILLRCLVYGSSFQAENKVVNVADIRCCMSCFWRSAIPFSSWSVEVFINTLKISRTVFTSFLRKIHEHCLGFVKFNFFYLTLLNYDRIHSIPFLGLPPSGTDKWFSRKQTKLVPCSMKSYKAILYPKTEDLLTILCTKNY